MNARIVILIALGCVAGMAGCASSPVPLEKIAVAKASVQRAEESGATQTAPVPLSTAREKLVLAQRAAASSDGLKAGQYADQANVDAQLAEAMAGQVKSHKAATDFDASMQALRQESMRPAQDAQ